MKYLGKILHGLAVVVAVLALVQGGASAVCNLKWAGSELETRTHLGVCQVKVPNMGWVPADKVRGW